MTPLGLRRKIALSFLFIILIWAFGFVWFSGQIPKTEALLPENSNAAIIVLTGDNGRMEYALELLAAHKGKLLFISGAGEKVSTSDILRQAAVEIRGKINPANILIGNKAENTIGNAQEIKNWLESTGNNKIILVTSDYHMPRALQELSAKLNGIYIIPAPVITRDEEMVFSEYHKYLASKLRHLFVSLMAAQ